LRLRYHRPRRVRRDGEAHQSPAVRAGGAGARADGGGSGADGRSAAMSLVAPGARATGRRPEFEREPLDARGVGEIERPLALIERIVHNDAVQRAAILLALVLCWELYARWLGNALLFPTFTETMGVFARDIATGVLPDRILTSLKSLAIGYAAGVAL